MIVSKLFRLVFFLLLAVAYTYYGFINKVPCGIDNECLYCVVKQLNIFDKIGTILIYIACLYLSGFWSILCHGISPQEDYSLPNWAGYVIGCVGIFMVYLL